MGQITKKIHKIYYIIYTDYIKDKGEGKSLCRARRDGDEVPGPLHLMKHEEGLRGRVAVMKISSISHFV